MTRFDYIIAGAGSAGCVLANRLSANPGVSVLLVEAGGQDTTPLIAMPGGATELMGDPAYAWHYPTRPFGPSQQVEYWVRGKTLGGSSSVNGMTYNRGNRADYDELESRGNPGWGWDDMLPVFRTIEDNALGASDVRGAGGPLHVSTVDAAEPLLEDAIGAGTALGWRRTRDFNESDEERLGYTMATIRDGRRSSAASAFLHPVMDRPNLTVAVHTVVDRVLLEGGRAVGVQGRQNGQAFEARAAREVILATGAIVTPKILQLSGIGPADTLRSAGVDVAVDSPYVGGRLHEHRAFRLQFRLTEDLGYNKVLGTQTGQQAAAAEYGASRGGVLARPPFDIVGFFKTRPDLERPDAQFQLASFSIQQLEPAKPLELEREPGMMCVAYALRPDSEGSIRITSADPDAALDIDPNYLATEHDRTTSVGLVRGLRRLFGTEPLANRIQHETVPGPGVQGDQEIIDAGLDLGGCGYHTVGTCAMGPNDDDVVDPELRVRGVTGLRVVDASVLPTMVSGNLNGPVTAVAWRAADLILAG
ncbi:GMC family oxidoreductase [Kribbella speibonae]|uniref:FAD-binding protein n=1 Tax=Kribbella speibonae TaxID=1572660 RepID=A0A4R0IEE3_9ACTN|nr:GMC family oxidoreductase N-terminal domain-containing protein [Kribbella speibonae]TCC24728.1 FAD-binding protein [Kribbella speibonae]TCC30859.1 FAD-binding protein [Kribbella speibonae]